MIAITVSLIILRLGIAAWSFAWALRLRSRVMAIVGVLFSLSTLDQLPESPLSIDPFTIGTDAVATALMAILALTIRTALRDAALRLEALETRSSRDHERRAHADRLQDTLVELVTRGDLADMRLADAAQIVTERTRAAIGASRAGVWLLENERATLRCVYLDAELGADGNPRDIELPASAYPRYFDAIASGRAVAATEAQRDPRTSEFTEGRLRRLDVRSKLDAALRRSGRVAGVLCIEQCGETRVWSPEEIEFVGEVGDLLGALATHESAVAARNALIVGLAKLADCRDTDTGEHLERIQTYSRLIATAARDDFAEIDDAWISRLEIASSLHDIGKVGIPDDVLLKPGALTPAERAIMERHTIIGADTLIEVQRCYSDDPLLAMGLQIALEHHERWDGKGYPCGVAGEEICLSARIVAVADVYDALTSRRVYKDALDHESACRIISREAGGQFDPRVIAAFTTARGQINAARQHLGTRLQVRRAA